MNSHPMITRSKSRNNLNEEAPASGFYNKVKRGLDYLNLLVSTMLITAMVGFFGIAIIFGIFDYITYLEHTYWGATSNETHNILMTVVCVLNIMVGCLFAILLYQEGTEEIKKCEKKRVKSYDKINEEFGIESNDYNSDDQTIYYIEK